MRRCPRRYKVAGIPDLLGGEDCVRRFDGTSSIVSGWKNKIQQAVANVTPAAVLAEQHRKMAGPGSGNS